jgi:hypothetical protein
MSASDPPVAGLATLPSRPAVLAAGQVAATTAQRCENCGAPVQWKFCGVCGQRLEPPVHSLWHFTTVATEDLTHADSRLWRTLGALLFRPGFLTREFLVGHRARYLPPLRLYLVLSVVFFLFASASQRQLQVVQFDPSDLPKATLTPVPGTKDSPSGATASAETAEQRVNRVCKGVQYSGPYRERVLPFLDRSCRQVVADNGRAVFESFLHNLPRAMFVFLPLLAGTMMLMYWRPRHYYVEHLLLFVHNHAFFFLIFVLAAALDTLLPAIGGTTRAVVFWYIVWYMFRSMRVVYGQGRWLTIGKLALLTFFYVVSGVLMLMITAVYSVLTL